MIRYFKALAVLEYGAGAIFLLLMLGEMGIKPIYGIPICFGAIISGLIF